MSRKWRVSIIFGPYSTGQLEEKILLLNTTLTNIPDEVRHVLADLGADNYDPERNISKIEQLPDNI